MEYRILGSTGLKVSAIGLGTWSMAGNVWGKIDDAESIATIHKALDLGINFFDTADMYGFGHSEKLLAGALGERRKDVVVATKVGIRWNNKGKMRHDLSWDYIVKQVDESLKRLQTDYIDLYQVHWPDPNTPISETMDALNECVAAGKVRRLGVSNLSVEQIIEYRKFGHVETFQPQLNLLERQAEVQLLPYCFKENVGVLVYSPLCRGLLSGKFKPGDEMTEPVRKRDPLFNGEAFQRNLRIVDRLKEMAAQQNKTVVQLAFAWALAHLGVSVALCGARKPAQIEKSVGGSGWKLSQEQFYEIDKILMTA